MKTLKDLFEVYKPKSPDEQKFVDKHVTIKHKDRNGNGDDVFKGNTKYIKRKEERHGYDVGDDEKVYEEVEDLDESVAKVANHLIKRYGENVRKSHVRSAANDFGVGFVALSHHVRKKLGVNRLDEEQIDELSTSTLKKYRAAAKADAIDADDVDDNRRYNQRAAGYKKAGKIITKRGENMLAKEEAEIDEKKLTPAEMKKREEIAKAMERENPGMDKSKKMAIATATAKRVAEELEAIEMDETLDEATKAQMRADLADLIAKSGIKPTKLPTRKAKGVGNVISQFGSRKIGKSGYDKKTSGLAAHTRGGKAVVGEEVEELDELSTKKLLDYMDKAADARGHRKLSTAKLDKRYQGTMRAADKVNKGFSKVHATEEVEQVDELSKKTLGSYVKKASTQAFGKGYTGGSMMVRGDMNRDKEEENIGKKNVDKGVRRLAGISKATDKLTKENIINNAIEKFMPELEDYVPMTQEEKLQSRLTGLSESHIHTLTDLFHRLSEDNQIKMLSAIDTPEGIAGMLDFALENRGE